MINRIFHRNRVHFNLEVRRQAKRRASTYAKYVIPLSLEDKLRPNWDKIKRSVEVCGFAHLQMQDASITTLKAVAALFGRSQKHSRSNGDGVTDVVGQALEGSKGQVVSNIEFFPHTDGHYLNGMQGEMNGRFSRVTAPHLILLQCVQPSRDGGVSVLVDSQKILKEIIRCDKGLIKPLFDTNATSVLRGDHLVMGAPVFKSVAPGRYAVSFSYDRDFFCAPQFQRAFAHFNQRYILHEAYQSRHHVDKNQILVIDNQRLLHGRTAFTGTRHFRRLWLSDPVASYPLVSVAGNTYYQSEEPTSNPLTKFTLYGPQAGFVRSMAPKVKTGISLPPVLNNLLKKILQRLQ